jgi:N-acetylmuramoyl-L-alanine amidase
MKFCIDPGHGGADPGAVGPAGTRECDVAYNIAEWLQLGLSCAGHASIMTRTRGEFQTLQVRCGRSNQSGVDRFVSIHANASTSPQAGGFEVWTSPGWTPADPIATSVFELVRRTFPDLRGRVDSSDGDPDKESGFYVLVHTAAPAILIETAFISNPLEEQWLSDVSWQMRMAGAILGGITRP